VAAILAVASRQITIWLEIPLFLQIMLEKWEERNFQLRAYLIPALVRLLPLAVVGYLFHVWHGLVPPQWKEVSFQLSAAPLACLFSLTAFIGLPFILNQREKWRPLVRDPWVILALAGGFLSALISPDTWNPQVGRWGGWIWFLAAHSPAIKERVLIFMVFSPIGAAFVAVMARLLWRQGSGKLALLWTGALLAWMLSFLVQTNIYQHYFEPTLVIFFSIATAYLTGKNSTAWSDRWALALLVGYEVFMILASIYGRSLLGLHLR